MYRYIAFSWDAKDRTKTAAVQRFTRLLLASSSAWQRVFDVPGLRVFHAPEAAGAFRAYVLKRDGGVVLGKLFETNPDTSGIATDPSFDERESDRLIESRGRHLVERYWGYYVAFLRAVGGRIRYVLRDPTGGLPCYLTKADDVDVILSDVEDCAHLELTPFSVDWSHITTFFLNPRLISRTTGFKEVAHLYAGECVSINYDTNSAAAGKVSRSFYWDPTAVCEANTTEDGDVARAALGGAIRHCVKAWASSYNSILLELSGGLDSSVVAACLSEGSAGPDVTCLHYFKAMSEGDERSYARLAAQNAGFELIEAEGNPSERPLESLLDRTRLATPSKMGFKPASALLKQQLVRERHVGAVFSGKGGDHLFQQERTRLIAAEYASRHGLRLELFRVVKDTGRMTMKSIWSVWESVVRYALLRQPFDPYGHHLKLPKILSEEARAGLSLEDVTHPWVQNASRLPASKIRQVFNVVDSQFFFMLHVPNAELVHPLISQPIIEQCLQIPSYVLAHRGRSRGLVRDAFERDLPTQIVHRYTKSGTTSYFSQMLVENAAFLRERLLDGVLVNEGIIDRNELEGLLSERNLVRGKHVRTITSILLTETWLSNWDDARRRTAA